MARANNVVQETSDYEQFSFIENNREVVRGHVEALKQAFDTIGNLTKVQPILVNDRMQVIDGQHRFQAARELGLPIHFTVVGGLGVAEARSMNILHRTWTVADFARSYALGGDVNYQKYLLLAEDYGFKHSILLTYAINDQMTGKWAEFREGNFVLTDEAGTKERLDSLAQVEEITPLAKNKVFAIALLRVMKTDGYSHRHMLSKMTLHPELLKRFASLEDALRMLEEVYNYKMHENNRLRLY